MKAAHTDDKPKAHNLREPEAKGEDASENFHISREVRKEVIGRLRLEHYDKEILEKY